MKNHCTLFIFALVFFTVSLFAIDFGLVQGTQYHPFIEWELTDSTFIDNPFDVVATARFTHQSGAMIETEMFYVENNIWRFRFSGNLTGDWSLMTVATDGDLDGHIGTIQIAANANPNVRGFLTGQEKYFWSGNQEVIIPNYVMYFGDIVSFHDNPPQINTDISEFMVGHGFTGFHIPSVGGRWFDYDATNQVVLPSHDNPDFRTFEALELLIRMTYEAGGHVHIWPWGDQARRWTPTELDGGTNGFEDLRLQRYIAARLGPVAGWSMGYAFDLDEWVSQSELHAWQRFMDDKMGWPHLLGGRFHQPNSGTNHANGVPWNSAMSYSAWEHHKPTHEVFRAAMSAVLGQPTFSEDRFRIRSSTRPKDFAADGVDTRRTMWYAAMAGGVASIWGNLLMASEKSDPYPNKEELKTFAEFFHGNNRFQMNLIPDSIITTEPCLFNSDDESYIVFIEETDSVKLDLSAAPQPYEAIAVNTAGAYEELNLGLMQNAFSTLEFPFTSDWALHLKPASSLPILVEYGHLSHHDDQVEFTFQIAYSEEPEEIFIERSHTSDFSFITIGKWSAEKQIGGTFIDANLPIEGNLFYRIGAVFSDGHFEYSKFHDIYLGDKKRFNIYPNPVNKFVHIANAGANSPGIFEIFNSTGRRLSAVYLEETKDNQITIDVGNLSSGIYFICRKIDGKFECRRFIKE